MPMNFPNFRDRNDENLVIRRNIKMDDIAECIIRTPEFQRLHKIRQTGLAFTVFPSATHSRFVHSVGVYHLLKRVMEHLVLCHGTDVVTPKYQKLIPLAGLCHDLGHGPFSHLFETLFVHRGWCHEEQSVRMVRRMVTLYNVPLTEDDLTFIAACIHPSLSESTQWTFQLVANLHNGLDMDKLDYLNRDSEAFGLSCPIQISRIIEGMRIQDGEIQYVPTIVDDLLDVFTSRWYLFRHYYQHDMILSIDDYVGRVMTNHCLEMFIDDDDLFVHYMTDDYIMQLIGPSLESQYFFHMTPSSSGKKQTASIVGETYQNNPLYLTILTDGSRLIDSGTRASTVNELKDVWFVS